ncbi:two-component system, chemotaxis family, CheB/CheR fusion protein [Pontibacter akesuensis]|uniref:protein-glutamate O-methyltransferase n=2 Tax=Pontibacter akesuensis TaxID=388950 RepID=A0A1I7GM98_9BACT|nr:two-component system, chemotaxis family, CheB/CheR fusion protein [Pontibacter akesuensis]
MELSVDFICSTSRSIPYFPTAAGTASVICCKDHFIPVIFGNLAFRGKAETSFHRKNSMTKSAENKTAQDTSGSDGHKSAQNEFVIGIGASAGGLHALEMLFSSVPQDSVAYVIVQHISSEHRNLLTELVAQYSSLQVLEAEHNTEVEQNKVYVIPNNKEIIIRDNRLLLLDKTVAGRSRTVDTFFTSLAADKGQKAIGVILSGTGTDGSEGARAIKKAGGLVLVQDPATARFDGMPRNAIKTGCADHVLAPELMPNEIFNFVKVTPITSGVTGLVNSQSQAAFSEILDMVHERTGIDFSNYKQPTIIRRISRRMAILNIKTLEDYLDFLSLRAGEVETLGREFLIGVTKFFRDEEAYQVLAEEVIPSLIHKKKPKEQLRIWIAGCSTGEEAYSIAILVREYMDKVKRELEVKIFASDIDREALDFAGKGIYPESSVADVSEARLQEFFVREEGKFRVVQRVRRMVIFAPHNVTTDPPFSKIDLVSCRNMLIYLNQSLQMKVISKFHYSLVVGGYIFLGSSESIGEQRSMEEVNKKWKIYRNTAPAHSLGMMDTFSNNRLSKRPEPPTLPGSSRDLSARQVLLQNFNELLNETVLEEYSYAAVYIDENYDVLHGAGKYKNYLDLPEQSFTFNLLKLVPQDLAVTLGTMLRKAILDQEKLSAHNVPVRDGSNLRHIDILVRPLLVEKKQHHRHLLVLFSEEQPRLPISSDQVVVFNHDTYESRVQELEIELQYTKDDLQAVVEELETANEELQSTNEELLSSNEELQSTNEELQSLNEELHTINAEHQYKIKALVELDDDLNNYFRSTDIGQIFVDRQLIIRKYTPAATKLINLIESDIGRSIYHISNNLRYEDLIEDVRHVIASNQNIERQVQDKAGVWYQMRVLPYITQERRIDGAIIIFIQINELKNLHLLHAGILNSSPNAIMALKAVRQDLIITDFTLNTVNYKAQELLDRPEANLIGKTLWKEYPTLLEQGTFEQLVQVVETGKLMDQERVLLYKGEQIWLHVVAVKFDDGLVLTLHNITERKQYEQALKQQQEEIRESVERFRTMLEAVPHITWTSKPSGENSSFNESWYEYTGLSKEESAGWNWKRAFHPTDLEQLMPDYMASLESGKVHSTQARILRQSDNRYRWHLIKVVPLRNESGEIMQWIGTATDIQDQKDAEEANIVLQVSQQREILNAVMQTQEEERSRISEALHNGLGQVLYAAKLNLDNLSPESEPKKKIKDNVDQLLRQGINITRDISSELTPSVLNEFGLKVAVEEIISRFSSPQLKIKYAMQGFDEKLDYTVTLSLYRIIQELLNNVIKHSGATEASVQLIQKDDLVRLSVKDNGKGMVDGAYDTMNGIGLSSIRNRLKLLGGKMEIKSSEGEGAEFKVCFTL